MELFLHHLPESLSALLFFVAELLVLAEVLDLPGGFAFAPFAYPFAHPFAVFGVVWLIVVTLPTLLFCGALALIDYCISKFQTWQAAREVADSEKTKQQTI